MERTGSKTIASRLSQVLVRKTCAIRPEVKSNIFLLYTEQIMKSYRYFFIVMEKLSKSSAYGGTEHDFIHNLPFCKMDTGNRSVG